jgi:hypothetical protein
MWLTMRVIATSSAVRMFSSEAEQATMTATRASCGDMADSGMVGSFKRLAADY